MNNRFYTILVTIFAFVACSEEEPIQYEDHNMKAIEADMKYNSNAEHFEVAYSQQNYFSFNSESIEVTGNYGTESWTDFNLYTESDNYNVDTDVTNWDLLFTSYTTPIDFNGGIMEYVVCGVLINPERIIEVRMFIDEEAISDEDRLDAFEQLTAESFDSIVGSSTMDVINYDWKTLSIDSGLYTINSNYFYLIETVDNEKYKYRFTGFYGTSADDRIIQAQYQRL